MPAPLRVGPGRWSAGRAGAAGGGSRAAGGRSGRYRRLMADMERRRRRLRNPGGGPTRDPGGTSAATAGVHDGDPAPPPRRTAPEERDGDRGLRGLVGSGNSQVRVTAAMRARDASRPTDADLAGAEDRLVLIRRNWVPREDLPRSGR